MSEKLVDCWSVQKQNKQNVPWTDPVWTPTAPKPKVKDHYHSHRLSYWLSLIPKLHVAGPIALTGVEHHLLTDHEDLNSYEGLVRESTPAKIRSLMMESNPAAAFANNINNSQLMISDLKNNPHQHPLLLSSAAGGTGGGNNSSAPSTKIRGVNSLNSDHPSSSGVRDKTSSSGSKSVSIDLPGFNNKKSESTFSDSTHASSRDKKDRSLDHTKHGQKNASSVFMIAGSEGSVMANYSTALGITIAVGVSLLILNVLVFAGIFYQKERANRIQVGPTDRQTDHIDSLIMMNLHAYSIIHSREDMLQQLRVGHSGFDWYHQSFLLSITTFGE